MPWDCTGVELPPPCDGATSQGVPEDAGGSGSARWVLQPLPSASSCTAGVAPHCSVPTIVPSCQGLSQTASCFCILLFCLPWEKVGSWCLLLLHLAGGLVIARPGLFCGHTIGDGAWQEQAAHPDLAVSPVPPPSLPRCQAGAPSCSRVQVGVCRCLRVLLSLSPAAQERKGQS